MTTQSWPTVTTAQANDSHWPNRWSWIYPWCKTTENSLDAQFPKYLLRGQLRYLPSLAAYTSKNTSTPWHRGGCILTSVAIISVVPCNMGGSLSWIVILDSVHRLVAQKNVLVTFPIFLAIIPILIGELPEIVGENSPFNMVKSPKLGTLP